MMKHLKTLCGSLAALAIVAGPQVAFANTVQVSVNGQPLASDAAPVERAGRVYVPMRAIFERLGATVVFGGGEINATSGTHTIGLRINSNNAVIDRQPTTLDSPPFLVGARAFVPLRFIAQALGAHVAYSQPNETVAITLGDQSGRGVVPRQAAMQQATMQPIKLLREVPDKNETVMVAKPEISASFGQPVDPQSIRISVDGTNISKTAYLSERGFIFDPDSAIPYGNHVVLVQGMTRSGQAFTNHWSFSNQAPVAANYLQIKSPGNGQRVGNSFVIEGTTRPNSHVKIVATSSATFKGFQNITESTGKTDVVADPTGAFIAHVNVLDEGAGIVDVELVSTSTDNASITRSLRLRP